MSDTETLIHCPLCGAKDILEQRGMFTTNIECEKPGDVPQEVKLKIYVCCQCGRMFNEIEAQAP
jgi:DNA-directed RNA polymerase subunit RPC12/RpoP